MRGAQVQDRLRVSNILQKIGIEINEKGSISFEGSDVSLTGRFTELEFKADRPFLFLIEDETTGAIVFAGKVTHPI